MTQTQWKALMGHVNLGSQMAAQHDAALVLIAVGEVEGSADPRGAWVTSGLVDEGSAARSEATLAMLECALQELTKKHRARFGTEPSKRAYLPKGKAPR